MQNTALLYALLLTGVAIGWWLGYRFAIKRRLKRQPDFIPSMEYLLAETNDATLNHLLNLPKLDDDALDLFQKIGRTLRQKGDTERAIQLHQSLFARTDLPRQALLTLKLELALDYLDAGLLDRAERLLQEFVQYKGKEPIFITAAQYLVEVYEAEGEWQKICDLYQNKQLPKQESLLKRVSHAYCELAERALKKGNYLECRQLCRASLKIQPQCARAYLIQGDLAHSQSEPNEAIRCYLRALELNPKAIIGAIKPLKANLIKVGDKQGLRKYFYHEWQASQYEAALKIYMQQLVQEHPENIVSQMLDELAHAPSNQGFANLVELVVQNDLQIDKLQLQKLYGILRAIVKHEPKFVCGNCGFKSNEYHWLCPSCRNWSTISNFVPKISQSGLEL